MTQEELEILVREIEKKIAKTASSIEMYREMTQPVAPDVAIGRISRMDAINNKSVVEAALREAEEKLTRLKMALAQVKSPDYGICIRCKAEIPFKRLLFMPESTKCVRCA